MGTGGESAEGGFESGGAAGERQFDGGNNAGVSGTAASGGGSGQGGANGGVSGTGGGAGAESDASIDSSHDGGSGGCATCDAGGCPAGETRCEGVCVDLRGDEANCGRCGHDCIGGKCLKGICGPWIVASEPVVGRVQIACDGTYLAWTNDVFGVSTIPVAGMDSGKVPRRLNVAPAGGLALSNAKVVWFTNDSNTKRTKLWTADETGANVGESPPFDTGGGAFAAAVEPSFGMAYVADDGGMLPDFDVYGCSPVGPDAVCAKIQTLTSTNAGFTDVATTAFALTGVESFLFYGGSTGLARLDLVTGEAAPLPNGATRNLIQTAVTDDQNVFWTEAAVNTDLSTTFAIRSALLSFANESVVVDRWTGSPTFASMTADNAYIYFSSSDAPPSAMSPTYIAYTPKSNRNSTAPTVLYRTDAVIVALVSAGGAVYWAERSNDGATIITIFGQVFI